ncbi:beta-N-acetylhexosaminidase [Sporosarcina sp. GW1-11]|uniref:beta-N-acetylhexosaminidase n=1 Tax=Sporosarcina sp. GW1-11 TaxID=2899126 RepID=UPI00294DF9B4|nr:beta-N-acetylhexosaminidase [Sporosarcina sp. GW1-11]MDV6377780.1 beta-N-acetylhexosaminidase [Sporosarcina sp. GW1-11]
MRNIVKLMMVLIACTLLSLLAGCSDQRDKQQQQQDEQQQEATPIEHISASDKQNEEIQAVLHHMSIDEKIGQLILMGVEGPQLDAKAKAFVAEQRVGGIILFKRNFDNVTQSLQLINALKEANIQGSTPLLIGVDEEGGRVTRLPQELVKTPTNRYIGNVAGGEFSFDIGELLGDKLHAFGLNMDFAPVLDVDSNPNNPVIGDRSYGANPQIVSAAGISQAEGMKSRHVIPVVKHFPGHGDTSVDSHIDLPVITHDKKRLDEIELLPFKQAIESGIDAVMVGHLIVQAYDPSTPASMSKPIIQELLRDQLHFDGVVITDDLIMGAVQKNYSIGEAALQTIQAGGDILLIGHGYEPVQQVLTALKNAVTSGELTEERINQSVERILKLKMTYELDDTQRDNIDVDELNRQTKELLEKMKTSEG